MHGFAFDGLRIYGIETSRIPAGRIQHIDHTDWMHDMHEVQRNEKWSYDLEYAEFSPLRPALFGIERSTVPRPRIYQSHATLRSGLIAYRPLSSAPWGSLVIIQLTRDHLLISCVLKGKKNHIHD